MYRVLTPFSNENHAKGNFIRISGKLGNYTADEKDKNHPVPQKQV